MTGMELMQQLRDQDVEKCDMASGDTLSSPALKERVEIAENSEKGDDNSSYAESVASECSMESDASSNALYEDSQVSDGDSPSEEKNLKRCPSGGSIVTYDEAASKLPEEGECERTVGKELARRSKSSQLNSLKDEQEISNNAGPKTADSAGPGWTEDKHCSYLNSIEQTFVNSLYGQDYLTVDGSGQDDQDCVESRPMYDSSSYGCELFTSLQRGCYDQREYYRPHFLHNFGPSTSAIFFNPWIQHFKPKAATPSQGGAGQDADTGHGPVEGDYDGNRGNEGVKEEVMESCPDFPEKAHGRSSRNHSQHYASTSAPVKADAGIQAKKRPCNQDPSCDVTYRPLKLKPTQRWLAEIDVEMEEQFLLKQKYLKEQADYSDLKADPQPHTGEGGGFDLNQKLDQEDGAFDLNQEPENEDAGFDLNEDIQQEKNSDEMPPIQPQASIGSTGLTPSSKESLKSKDTSNVQDNTEKQLDPPTLVHHDTAVLLLVEGISGEERERAKKADDAAGHNAPPRMGEKSLQEEANANSQVDRGFDDDEEAEFFRRSPHTSKTYTWGAVGPRRRLHNESNFLGEATVLSESIKDSKNHELQNKAMNDQKTWQNGQEGGLKV